MFNSYHMVFVNILTSFVLLCSLFIYRFIYPARKFNYLIVVILISFLPLVSLLRFGDYESGDFNIHIYRSMAFFDALKDWQIMPSWPKDLNATYGYPLFIFLNPLPYYGISFFHLLGFSFIASTKLFLGISFIISGIGMYLWIQKMIRNSFAAYTSAVFYLFAPYHLVDLHFRATVGETLFFAILPFEFLFLYQVSVKKNSFWIISSAIGYFLLFASHQAMAIFSSTMLFLYSFYLFLHQKMFLFKKILYILLPFLLGIIISGYIWIPHVFLSRYTLVHILSSEVVSFPKLSELLFSPWRYGFLFQGPKGELSFAIGYIHLFILVLSILMIINKRKIKRKNDFTFWFTVCLLITFLVTPFSYFIWKSIRIVNVAQFSSRLLLIVNLCIAVIAGCYVLNSKKKNLVFSLLFLVVFSTILNWGHRRIIPQITDETLRQNLPLSTAQGEGLAYMGNSVWWKDTENLWISHIPDVHLEVKNENIVAAQIKRTSINHQYITQSDSEITLKENTIYFPGWKVFVNYKRVPITINNAVMEFKVPRGLSYINIVYQDIGILFFSKVLTFVSFFLSIIFILRYFLYTKR